MSKHFTIAHIRNGEIENKKSVRTLFETLKDGKYLVEISGADKRSSPQNRYYWGIVVPLIQKGIKDLGTELTKDEVHEFLKARFNLSDVVNQETGEAISIPISTTRLNKEEFSEYIDRIQRFSAEFLSIEIPSPGIQTAINY